MFTVGTSFNFHAFKLLGFRCFFDIRIVFVMKLLQQTILLGQLLLPFTSAEVEIEIIWWLKLLQVFLVSRYTSLSSVQTSVVMWSYLQYLLSLFRYPLYIFAPSIKGEFHSLMFFFRVCLPPLCSRNPGLTVPFVLTSHACFLPQPWSNPRLCLNCFRKHASVLL